MLIQLNPVGGSYKAKSIQLSGQRTVNFWPQKQGNDRSYSQEVLTNFPCLKLWTTDAAGPDRGAFVHKEVLYRVAGNTLYSVSQGGTHTALGTIPGSNRVIFSAVSDTVGVVNSGTVYSYNASSGVFQQENDVNFETPNSIASINSQAIYDGDDGRFVVSNAGTLAQINGLNYASLESVAQDLIRVYSKNQIAWMMGQVRLEPWWNSGSGNPPFDRVESGIIEVGIGAIHSVAENQNAWYFFGSDDQDYIVQGYNAVVISNEAMAREFRKYRVKSDAIGFCLTVDKKQFRFLIFPTEGKTWVYPEGEEWFELQSNGGRWYGNSGVYAYGKNLIFDYRNGNIYELDDETYEDNSDTVTRTRVSAPIHGGLFQAPGKRITINRLEFLMDNGNGIPTGQGSDPELMFFISEDGGEVFGTEMRVKLGNSDKQQKIELFNLGSFYNGVLKIEYSDPTAITIFGMAADVEIGI
jgi:hypothetical protein